MVRFDKNDKTVVYYTAHTERPEFEDKIRGTLLESIGDLPLISVSQKPLDFGKNICVGEVGISSHNAWRQLMVGAEAATTAFICAAESDYLYPKEHFEFTPRRLRMFYMPDQLYMIYPHRPPAFRYKPSGCEGCIVVGREFLISRIRSILDPFGMWNPDPVRFHLFHRRHSIRFSISVPLVMFKTERALTKRDHHASGSLPSLPKWGSAKDLLKTYAG